MHGFVLILILITLIGSAISYAANRAMFGDPSDGSSKPSRSKPRTVSSKPIRITQEERDYYELNYREFNRGIDARTSKTAKSALERLETGYAALKGKVSAISATCYEDDIQELRSWAETLVYEEWKDKAQDLIYQFLCEYFDVITAASVVDKVAVKMKRFSSTYDRFLTLTDKTFLNNQRLLVRKDFQNKAREMLRELYEECAESYRPIKYHILFGHSSSCAALKQQFVANMSQHTSSQRTVATSKVPAKRKKAPSVSQSDSKEAVLLSRAAFLSLLRAKDAEYIDKTAKGGALYFFNEAIAKEASSLGFRVMYAQNGTKGTGHRPAWYVRFTE